MTREEKLIKLVLDNEIDECLKNRLDYNLCSLNEVRKAMIDNPRYPEYPLIMDRQSYIDTRKIYNGYFSCGSKELTFRRNHNIDYSSNDRNYVEASWKEINKPRIAPPNEHARYDIIN